MSVRDLFATRLFEAEVDASTLGALAHSIRSLAADDAAGQMWSREHRYAGYTSVSANVISTPSSPLCIAVVNM